MAEEATGVRATALALAVYAAATAAIVLGSAGGPVASIWVANALIVGALAYRPETVGWGHRLVRMLLVGAVLVGANVSLGRPTGLLVVMSAANVAEIELLLLLFRRGAPLIPDVAAPRGLALFVMAAVVVAAVCAIGVAAYMGGGTVRAGDFQRWVLADALGLVVVTPLVIAVRVHRGSGAGWRRTLGRATLAAGAVALPTAALFLQRDDHLLPLVFPALLLVAANFGFLGAVVGNAAFAVLATALTTSGYGPIAPDGNGALQVLYLQFYFAAATLTTLPVAAIVTRQQTLTEEALGREHRFRRVAEVIPTGIVRVDNGGRLQWGNSAFQRSFGIPAETVAAHELAGLLAAEDAAAGGAALAGALADGIPLTADWRFRTAAGGAQWMRLALAPELDGAGNPAGWTALLLDTDESERARRALAASETLHRLLAEHSSDMIARLDMSGRFLFASPASERLLGLPLDELIGARPVHLILPEDRTLAARTLLALRRFSTDTTITIRIRPPGRAILWIEAQLVVDESSGEREIVLSARDVTRRRIAEQTAAQSRAAMVETNRLLIMAESAASVGHWQLDAATGLMRWSETLYELTGLAHGKPMTIDESLLGYSPRQREQLRALLDSALLDGTGFSYRGRFQRMDGAIRHIRLVAQPDRAGGRVTGVFGIAQDITEMAEAQEELVRARDAAEAAAAAESAFLNMMSHEIRTPLTGVLGAIELMRGAGTVAAMREQFGRLDASSQLLSGTLNAVLDFSRLRDGRIALETIDFDLRALLVTVREAFAAQAIENDLALALMFPGDGPVWVRGDRARLVQIIANLVANALKFTAAGGVTIRVATPAGDDRWTIAVADTGPGIEPARLEAIFAPFVQADASTARLHGGSGLGLAIARELARAMDGDIAVETAPGAGATFAVTLPLPAGRATADTAARLPPVPAMRLLLADDNQINAGIIAEIARRAGHHVTVVNDGAAAVQAAAAEPFDAILMDMRMPEIDGPAAARHIRRGDGPNALSPIVAVTADASAAHDRAVAAAGFDDFLAKPVDAAALETVLRRFAGADALSAPHVAALADALPAAELRRLIEIFGSDAARRLHAMEAARATRDRRALAEAAHALRGSALGLGAEQLATLLGEIETAARNGRPFALAPRQIDAAARAALWSLRAIARNGPVADAPLATPFAA